MSSRSNITEDERSEEEGVFGEGETAQAGSSAAGGSTKRTPRACDRCRKSKSKCEPGPGDGDRCRGCLAAGTECTFSGPTFRRGPPKGYIQALERRLHQMESVLAAIMSSDDARAVGIINDLRRDHLAQHILDGVDSGPFGPSGREQRSVDPTQDNFFASIVTAAPKVRSDRSRRQSRSTRESVIQQKNDPAAIERPTLEWQDRLSEALGKWSRMGHSGDVPSIESVPVQTTQQPTALVDDLIVPARQRRRVAGPPPTAEHDLTWDEIHATADSDQDELDDCADAFGQLSLDENREVRYHGKSSGLHFLAHDQRWDKRNLGGVWKFPMSKLWPPVPSGQSELSQRQSMKMALEASVKMPPLEVQQHLLRLYFTYVNPALSVLDQPTFMEQYHVWVDGPSSSSSGGSSPEIANAGTNAALSAQTVEPERMQKLSKLLLFAVFAFGAQYWDADQADKYAVDARRMLDMAYQESRTSTVQALVLMGVREFGLASVEAGWLHVGMAIRMAVDLGLNRNSDRWLNHGRELFGPGEQSIRKRIWWSCCFADKYASHFLGRPMAVHEADASTLLPKVSEKEDEAVWVAINNSSRRDTISPMPGLFQSCFRALAQLALIHGEIIEKIYPVTRVYPAPRRVLMEQIHQRLLQWSVELPESLQYSSQTKRPCPPPHVLVMHLQFWVLMLLLHRPFIPKCLRTDSPASYPSRLSNDDHVPWKSFDFCQSAASHVSSFASLFHRTYDIRWAPPMITSGIQSAGIMHIVTLRYRPQDPIAAAGLHDCINACERMRDVWHAAARIADLLRGAGVKIAVGLTDPVGPSRKRPAEIQLEEYVSERSADPPQDEQAVVQPGPSRSYAPHGRPVQPAVSAPRPHHHHHQQAPSYGDNLLIDLLGPEYTNYEPSICVAPDYDWWTLVSATESTAIPQTQVLYTAPAQPLAMPSQSFTFGQQQFSQSFLQGIRDPPLHFPLSYHPQ